MGLLQYNTGIGGSMWMELGTRGGALSGENDPTAVKWPGFTGVANDGNGLPYGQGGTVDAAGSSGLILGPPPSQLILIEGILLTSAPALAGTITIFRQDGSTILFIYDIAAAQAAEYFELGVELAAPSLSTGFSAQMNQADMEALIFFRDLSGARVS